MAEMEVRSRRPLVWPWIVGLTVAAVLLWLLSERLVGPSMGGDTGPAERVQTPPVTTPASGQVHMA
ncbi:MAG TPA: hypothetical protein VFQ76_21370 [Longimicrobiaceae bacterium]|nr:hypothetical protein [Longimicrobiaceae bacterium]